MQLFFILIGKLVSQTFFPFSLILKSYKEKTFVKYQNGKFAMLRNLYELDSGEVSAANLVHVE